MFVLFCSKQVERRNFCTVENFQNLIGSFPKAKCSYFFEEENERANLDFFD